MQILDTFSHMPFIVGDTLYFCQSAGLQTFAVEQTAIARRLGVPVQSVTFQPWSLCIKRGDTISPVEIPGLSARTPAGVFCNPVVVERTLSFTHGGTLYSVNLDDASHAPSIRASGVSCGFSGRDGDVLVRKHEAGSLILFPDGTSRTFPDENIVRIIPHENELIITSKNGPLRRSFILYPDGSLMRVTVNGVDVYKCCIDGGDVIHAVCGDSFEDRKLHRDPYTLIPHA